MLDRAILKLTKPIVDGVANYAMCYKFTADQATFTALGLGLFSSVLIAAGLPMIALLPMLLGRLADGVDGAIARGGGGQSDRGAFLDIALDFVFYASVPLAFAMADPAHNALAGATLLGAFVTTGTSFLAYASIAAKRGEKSEDYPTKGIFFLGGITEGSETIALFIICCLWPAWFPAFAYIYAALCAITTFTRIAAGWNKFRH